MIAQRKNIDFGDECNSVLLVNLHEIFILYCCENEFFTQGADELVTEYE